MRDSIRVKWPEMKTVVDSKSMSVQYVELTNYYVVKAFDGLFVLESRVEKDGGSDQTDFDSNYKSTANQELDRNQYNSGDLQVKTELSGITLVNNALPVSFTASNDCPTMSGSKWRTEVFCDNIDLNKNTYTNIKSLTNGTLISAIIDFDSDRVDVKITIDGQDIFDIDLDDLEDVQPSGAGSSGGGLEGTSVVSVGTGSKFTFIPPCGLTYSTLVISAIAESNNKEATGYIINYVVD